MPTTLYVGYGVFGPSYCLPMHEYVSRPSTPLPQSPSRYALTYPFPASYSYYVLLGRLQVGYLVLDSGMSLGLVISPRSPPVYLLHVQAAGLSAMEARPWHTAQEVPTCTSVAMALLACIHASAPGRGSSVPSDLS